MMVHNFIKYAIVSTLLLVCYVSARSTLDVCKRIPIHTLAPKINGSGGFQLTIPELEGKKGYKPGATYTVHINGTKTGHTVFLGFMLIAVPQNATNENSSVGTFIIPRDGRVQFGPRCNNSVVTHRYLMIKRGIAVRWRAPEEGIGCIQFRTALIETPGTWYKDDGSLTHDVCEDKTASIATPQGDATATEDDREGCCACGGAKYKMLFQGMWTRQRHPNNFPTEPNQLVSLHWSRILGASHSNDYKIWQYGEKASSGVKELCEFGHSYKLTKDFRDNDKKIKTVIRTTPLWGEKNIRGSVQADFFVDQHAHLLSMLSMIGPSPDWCVGVSKLNLCNNCTWRDRVEVDLFPWDAGTDSGLSYFSRNIATNKAEPIHRITNRYPNHADSPFYGPNKIKSLAKLTLTKTQDLPCEDSVGDSSSGESAVSNSVLIERMKKKMMMKKKIEMEKCATTQWTGWSDCNVPCGPGRRSRRRLLKNIQISPAACNTPLIEKEPCQGQCISSGGIRKGPKELPDDYIVRHAEEVDTNDPCRLTEWSDWAPCSVTCGMGLTERWRMFVYKNASNHHCKTRPALMEKDLCIATIKDCRKAFLMKNFSAICSRPHDTGPCKGSFQRWYYNKQQKTCMQFTYGGCRGNENKFKSEEECMENCRDAMAGVKTGRNEVISASTEVNTRTRVTQTNMNDHPAETPLQRRLRKKKSRKRKNRKRARAGRKRKNRRRNNKNVSENTNSGPRVACRVSQWTDWSPCSVTCGKGVTMKIRTIEVQPQNGGRRCPRKLRRMKKCRAPVKCPRDCKLSEWGEWSPCTQTCGDNGVQKRRRTIIKRPKRGGMDCPARREKRFCILPSCPKEDQMMQDSGYRWYP